jgi:hypothetical protein
MAKYIMTTPIPMGSKKKKMKDSKCNIMIILINRSCRIDVLEYLSAPEKYILSYPIFGK